MSLEFDLKFDLKNYWITKFDFKIELFQNVELKFDLNFDLMTNLSFERVYPTTLHTEQLLHCYMYYIFYEWAVMICYASTLTCFFVYLYLTITVIPMCQNCIWCGFKTRNICQIRGIGANNYCYANDTRYWIVRLYYDSKKLKCYWILIYIVLRSWFCCWKL